MTPLTVLMTVYNDAAGLPSAIGSILAQTYPGFRFLILDDCSTDDSARVVESYRDSRIELVRLPKNIGQTAALNIGLRRAQTPWIARMDADDFSAPDRLERQIRTLERTPDLGCLGTAAWEFHTDPRQVDGIVRRPLEHDEIRRAALRGAGMVHGSMVVRREALLECGGYDERYRYASDREMFLRLFRRVRAGNLSEPLLGIRRDLGQDSFSVKAAEEYIEIFERLLAGDGPPREETAVIRRSLAYSHLFRARCLRLRGNYRGWLREQGIGLTISPPVWLRSAVGTMASHLLPAGAVRALRGKAA